MKQAVLKYFVAQDHLFALLAVQHACHEDIVVTGCAPLRSTTVDYLDRVGNNDQVTLFECVLPLLTCDHLEVYIDDHLLTSFFLHGQFITALPGPEQLADVGRAYLVTWF